MIIDIYLFFWNFVDCKSFMEKFQEVVESQGKKEVNKDATAAAELLEKLSVEDDKKEMKAKEEPSSVEVKEEKEPEKETEKADSEKKD